MLELIYTILLSAWVVINLPIAIYKKAFLKKKIPFLARFSIPSIEIQENQSVVWVHAVSLGEMKLAIAIMKELQETCSFQLIVSTQTQTGYEFAKSQSLKNVFYFPIDFPYLQKKLVQKIRPDFFFLIESDFWYEQLKNIKDFGAKIFLLNGKMSDRSFSRWKNIPKLSAKIFNYFDGLFVQDDEMKNKFSTFVDASKIYVTGNLKLVKKIPKKKDLFSILQGKKVITIACTHEHEEVELYNALKPLIQEGWILVFAPRHPERFDSVYVRLKKLNQSVARTSLNQLAEVLLVDQMGVLNELYQHSLVVVMGGSFSSKKGGHDIFEPILAGVYVYFGPYMQTQKYLKKIAEENHLAEEKQPCELLDAIRSRNLSQESRQLFTRHLQNFKEEIKNKKKEFLKKIQIYLSA